MSTYKEKYVKEVQPSLLKSKKYANVMQIPKIQKIVISRGLGEAVKNNKAIESSVKFLISITGQKPVD